MNYNNSINYKVVQWNKFILIVEYNEKYKYSAIYIF